MSEPAGLRPASRTGGCEWEATEGERKWRSVERRGRGLLSRWGVGGERGLEEEGRGRSPSAAKRGTSPGGEDGEMRVA
jgi:hypothetical protein